MFSITTGYHIFPNELTVAQLSFGKSGSYQLLSVLSLNVEIAQWLNHSVKALGMLWQHLVVYCSLPEMQVLQAICHLQYVSSQESDTHHSCTWGLCASPYYCIRNNVSVMYDMVRNQFDLKLPCQVFDGQHFLMHQSLFHLSCAHKVSHYFTDLQVLVTCQKIQ